MKPYVEALGTQVDGHESHFIRLAWIHEHDVVRHEVVVGEGEFHLLARLHGQFRHVVHHLFRDGGDADRRELRCVLQDAGLLVRGNRSIGNDAATIRLLDVDPEVLHGLRGDAGVRLWRSQELIKQVVILDVVLLVQPERFKQMMRVFGFLRIELLDPLLDSGDHLGGIPATEFDPGAMTNAVSRRFQIIEQARESAGPRWRPAPATGDRWR